MHPSSISAHEDHRTWTTIPGSFIMMRNAPEWPWVWAFPTAPASFIVFSPPRELLSRADLRTALLHGETYLADALDAQIEGDDAGVRAALEVLRSIVQVALDQLRKPSSEYLSVH